MGLSPSYCLACSSRLCRSSTEQLTFEMRGPFNESGNGRITRDSVLSIYLWCSHHLQTPHESFSRKGKNTTSHNRCTKRNC
eukprot:938961-Amphidinium_carterae.2